MHPAIFYLRSCSRGREVVEISTNLVTSVFCTFGKYVFFFAGQLNSTLKVTELSRMPAPGSTAAWSTISAEGLLSYIAEGWSQRFSLLLCRSCAGPICLLYKTTVHRSLFSCFPMRCVTLILLFANVHFSLREKERTRYRSILVMHDGRPGPGRCHRKSMFMSVKIKNQRSPLKNHHEFLS